MARIAWLSRPGKDGKEEGEGGRLCRLREEARGGGQFPLPPTGASRSNFTKWKVRMLGESIVAPVSQVIAQPEFI